MGTLAIFVMLSKFSFYKTKMARSMLLNGDTCIYIQCNGIQFIYIIFSAKTGVYFFPFKTIYV